jgi:uncharacterized delta-60 repeat protein
MDSDFVVLRLNADGTPDTTFGTGGAYTLDVNNRNASPRTATLLADGSILVSGYYDDGGVVKPILFKLTSAGALDPSFGTNGVFTQTVLAAITEAYAAVQQGSNFVTVGYGRGAAPETLDWVSLRVTGAGVLDTTYGTNGVARFDVAGFNDNGRSLAALPDGRLLLVGGGRPVTDNVDAMALVLNANGQPDTTFGENGRRLFNLGGPSDFFWSVAVNPAGTQAAIVGTKGGTTAPGNDDAAILLLPLQ